MTVNFIQRPVLSIVISLLIVLLGILSLTRLPMTQFPSIAPPEVNVTVEFTGANAETVTKAAIVPLERAIKYAAAEKAFRESLRLYKRYKNANGIAHTYGFIGHVYEKKPIILKPFAIKTGLKRIPVDRQQKSNSKIYENLGSIHEDKRQLDSARFYFMLAEQINRVNNNQLYQIEVINNLGDVLRKSGKYKQSLRQTYQAMALAHKLNDQYQLGSAYRDLSNGDSVEPDHLIAGQTDQGIPGQTDHSQRVANAVEATIF